MISLLKNIFYIIVPILVVLNIIVFFLGKKIDNNNINELNERLKNIKEKINDN